MSSLTIEDLEEKFLQVRALTPADDDGYINIGKAENKENYCQLLFDFVVDLKSYLRSFDDMLDNEIDAAEVVSATGFIEKVINYFGSFTIFGKKPQTLVDTIFLLFGIAVYYKASLRIRTKTIELLFLSQKFEELEKLIYNSMYDALTGFNR